MRDAERRQAVLICGVENGLALPDQRIDVEDVPRHELLEDVERALIAQAVDRRPELLLPFDPMNADGRGIGPRLEHPWQRYVVSESVDRVVVHDRHEIGHENALVARADAHRELVAEVARGRLTHSGHAQVLAQERRHLDVEVVERDDPVQDPAARDMTDALEQAVAGDVAGNIEGVVDGLARPVGVLQGVDRQQQHGAALTLALADELLAFFVRGDAQNRHRPVF
jgi:hypothetical protein